MREKKGQILITLNNEIKESANNHNCTLVYYHYRTRGGGENKILKSKKSTKDLWLNNEGDFAAIRVAPGQKYIDECSILLPLAVDYEFLPGRDINMDVGYRMFGDTIRAVLTIPAGPPTWELKIKFPTSPSVRPEDDNVTIGDIPPGGEG